MVIDPNRSQQHYLAGRCDNAIHIPAASGGNAAMCQRLGWIQLNAATAGAVAVAGKCSDGSATITFSAVLWPDGKVPTDTALYKTPGAIRRWQRQAGVF